MVDEDFERLLGTFATCIATIPAASGWLPSVQLQMSTVNVTAGNITLGK